MKKLIIILSIIMLSLTTGCTAVRMDTKSIDNIVSVVLSKDNTLYNRVGKGYKYYIPRGVSYIDTNELNDKLYSNGNYYYLYIDAVNYYYKNKVEYKENRDAYYSRKLEGQKEGYLEINELDGKYLINFVYNYAKIEVSVANKEDLNEVILNASYILSTVKFNDNNIKLMLDEEYFTNKEEKYEEFSKDSDKEEEENNVLEFENVETEEQEKTESESQTETSNNEEEQ